MTLSVTLTIDAVVDVDIAAVVDVRLKAVNVRGVFFWGGGACGLRVCASAHALLALTLQTAAQSARRATPHPRNLGGAVGKPDSVVVVVIDVVD